ncbi:hypothetical protein [Nonomuraea roseoviolacea]|uniref:Nucleoside-diphosphate-sugar epimerase n=1 Tax=Nonomuraea roseoviolacea subsp. carminata TaxID=160689 RepID=A0ABT1K5H8_9ACTN|nr:hypothetical protein [Nonomuraea roseoviolacea]MCP2348274.1 nucleoside-diphosphate-sugar epimerase [Nonomuraea roseoviolacea subsp. carminata]
MRATLGRASDYYGPGGVNTVIGPTVFAAALAGKTARWVGDLDQPHTVAYLPDIAAALVTLGERAEADGRAWHLPAAGPAAGPVTGRRFLDLVRGVSGAHRRPPDRVGERSASSACSTRPCAQLGETWYQRDRPFISDDSAFRNAFGPVKVTPRDEGVAATRDWYRHNAA